MTRFANQSLGSWAATLLLMLSLAGCGPSDNTPESGKVKGKVTKAGAPLAEGRIYFENVAEGKSNALTIKSGDYTGDVAIGNMKARVVETTTTPGPMNVGETTVETELQKDIEVPAIKSGDNVIPDIAVP